MNEMRDMVIAITVIFLFSGCNVYKNYERPEKISVNDSLYRLPAYDKDTSTIASISWRQLFTDEKLQNLIECGLENNMDLKIACLKIKEAEAALLTSKLSFLPSVILSSEASISRLGSNSVVKTYNVGGTSGWEIDLFGKLKNSKKAAETFVLKSRAYARAVKTQIVATVADSYYMLLTLDEQLKISRKTADNWKSCVETLRALKINGTVKESDIAQAEAEKCKVESSLLLLEQQIQNIENSLSVLLGNIPGRIERGVFNNQDFPDSMSVGIPLQLLRNRPDIMQAELALAHAYYVTNHYRAAFYPSITLSGSAGWTNSGNIIVDPASWLLNAVGSIILPLFERGKNIANLKIAKAQQEEALLSFQQSILNAGAEVNDALVSWQSSRKRVNLGKQQIESLKCAVKNTEYLMKYGNVNYLEVLISQQNLLQAQLTNVEDKYNVIKGIIDLYYSLGGGIN